MPVGNDGVVRSNGLVQEPRFFRNAGAPVNGAVGTGTQAGNALAGDFLFDTTNKKLYLNAGADLAAVDWRLITSA